MPDACEANALNILYAQTTVPVPRVHRVIPLGPTHVIALEYIEGDLLSNVWSTYSLWRKIYIGFTLRRYIRQIRRTCKAPPSELVDHSVEGWYCRCRLILVESSQKAAINAVVNLHSVSSGQVNCPLKTVMESN